MLNPEFNKTTLPNGLRVLTERHPQALSATVGVWIVAGSIYEQDSERGLAHLLEHMVFKGTARRTMHDIAVTMDSIGGQINAFTDREYVCYHAKVLAEHAPLVLQLLCDLVTAPLLKKTDLEVEKGVILEEIKAIEDAPEELVEDLFIETIWEGSRWGRSILGTPESVSALTAKDLQRFMQQHYTPRHVVVAAVGDVQHDAIVAQAQELLKTLPGESQTSRRQPRPPNVKAHNVLLERDTEQVHLCCGMPAYGAMDEKRYTAGLLETILSGGYSSRLFQEIREKHGLCYNIGPWSTSYRATGFWGVETSVAPETAGRVADLIGQELRNVKTDGVLPVELERAQQMTRANILLSEESSSAQMSRIARNELYYGRQRATSEVLEQVLAVTPTAVHEVALELFDAGGMNLTAVGPFADSVESLQIDLG